MPLTADPSATRAHPSLQRSVRGPLPAISNTKTSLDDAEIIKRVDAITALLFAGPVKANRSNDQPRLKPYQWFATLVDDLMDDVRAGRLMG